MPLMIKNSLEEKKDPRDLVGKYNKEIAKKINNSINEVIKESRFDSIIYSIKSEIDDIVGSVENEIRCMSGEERLDLTPMRLNVSADDMCLMREFIENNKEDILSGFISDIVGEFKADIENKTYLTGLYKKLKKLEKATSLINEGIKECVERLASTYYTPRLEELEEEINKYKGKTAMVVVDDATYVGELICCSISPWKFTIKDKTGKEIEFKDKLGRYMIK